MNDISDIKLKSAQNVDQLTVKKRSQPATGDFAAVLDKEMNKTQNSVLDNDRELEKQKNKTRSLEKKTKKENCLPPFASLPVEALKNSELTSTENGGIKIDVREKNQKPESTEQSDLAQRNGSAQGSALNAVNKTGGESEEAYAPLNIKRDPLFFANIDKLVSRSGVGAGPELFQEMIKELTSKKEGDLTKLRLVLKPEELGELEVSFVLKDKKLQVSIAASEETRKLLQGSENELRELLSAAGFQLTDLDLSQRQGFSSGDHEQGLTGQTSSEFGSLISNNGLNQNGKKDIINNINNIVAQLIINYVA